MLNNMFMYIPYTVDMIIMPELGFEPGLMVQFYLQSTQRNTKKMQSSHPLSTKAIDFCNAWPLVTEWHASGGSAATR